MVNNSFYFFQHDFPSNCIQNYVSKGHYIMHPSGVQRFLEGNYKFSPCSAANISAALTALDRFQRNCLTTGILQDDLFIWQIYSRNITLTQYCFKQQHYNIHQSRQTYVEMDYWSLGRSAIVVKIMKIVHQTTAAILQITQPRLVV